MQDGFPYCAIYLDQFSPAYTIFQDRVEMTSNATKSEPLPALRTTNHSKIADPLINFCRYCRFWLSPSSALLLTLLWVQNPEHKLDFEGAHGHRLGDRLGGEHGAAADSCARAPQVLSLPAAEAAHDEISAH